MDQEEIDKVVLAYLDKRGFKQAELDFQQEKHHHHNNKGSNTSSTAPIDPDIAKQFLVFPEVDIPAQYQEGYVKLRSWAYNSLDQYQHELVRILYPVFVHGFMDLVAKGHIQEARAFFNSFRGDHEVAHSRDLQKLEGVLTPLHLEEMAFAHSLRQTKVNLKICQYSYDLLLQFLHKSKSTTTLGIINEHINFQVSPGQPSSIADEAEFVTLGSSNDAVNLVNQKGFHWGLLEDSLEEKLGKTGIPKMDSEKAEMREVDLEENKKRPVDGSKQSSTLKKLKRDKVTSTAAKASRPDNLTVSGAPRVKTELPLPVMPMEVEHSILEDLRNRVQLSSITLPSISFYTFINSHNGLNCASISHDGSLVAGGFSDSSLKVWDMAKLGLQNGHSFQGESEVTSNEHLPSSNAAGRSYTLFRGHAGPVHSATFSPFRDFLLSSSSDSTIRLWSTKLNANLVCYKGHNYPVWDVQDWHMWSEFLQNKLIPYQCLTTS